MDEDTCDWCGIDYAVTQEGPYWVKGEHVCVLCMLTAASAAFALWEEGLQAAQEDSPPET